MAQDNNEIIVFNDNDLTVEVNVSPEEDTVWLSLNQISELFDKNKSTISRHINNIVYEGEIEDISSVAKNATELIDKFDPRTGANRKTSVNVTFYNLDMIISIGYRTKSTRATKFRKWATFVLKDYALKGYVFNENKINYDKQLQLIKVLERANNQIESKEILDILEQYTLGLQLLDDYDHQRIQKPKGKESIYLLKYAECMKLIANMRRSHESDVFGVEREGCLNHVLVQYIKRLMVKKYILLLKKKQRIFYIFL